MSWETFEWRTVDAETPSGTAALAELASIAKSAVEEAASALVLNGVTIETVEVADAPASALSVEFVPATSFELLGTPRRGLWVALDPASGTQLGGREVTGHELATVIVEALDGVLVEILGEGLSLDAARPVELEPASEVVVFRLALRDQAGSTVVLACVVEAPVPVELATHVAALQAMEESRTINRKPSGAGAPAAPSGGATTEGGSAATREPAPAAPAALAAPDAPSSDAPSDVASARSRPLVLEAFTPTPVIPTTPNIELLMGVQLAVTVELGRAQLTIRDVLSLAAGSIIELDKLAGEKVDVLVNGHPLAQGEVVVVDENFGVRITDVVSRQRRILSADGAA